MSGPSSVPRAERAGTPGANWESELVWSGERVVDDEAEEPRANRAARRAARRAQRRSDGRQAPCTGPIEPQEARERLLWPLSRPNSPEASPSPPEPETGAQGRHDAPPTDRSLE